MEHVPFMFVVYVYEKKLLPKEETAFE